MTDSLQPSRRVPAALGWDGYVASAALVLMVLVPLVEIATRPLLGRGIDNAPAVVQHMGLLLAMFGSVAAERSGHLTTLGGGGLGVDGRRWRVAASRLSTAGAALVCGMLALASWQLVDSERQAARELAYGLPIWWIQAAMPVGFMWLGARLGGRTLAKARGLLALHSLFGLVLPLLGFLLAWQFEGSPAPLGLAMAALLLALMAGSPIFAVLGGLALALFWHAGQPLASVALSHYQITVNPSLPALPLFTLAGLVFARTDAASRLGALFVAMFGGASRGTAVAAAALCSCFTALTGGSGVTILALGGLLLPLLRRSGYPEQRGIGLVTSASALGVLLAPSVPLILYAVIARVPINTMFLAGLVPAVVMVAFLLVIGGFLRTGLGIPVDQTVPTSARRAGLAELMSCAWTAKWEIGAPIVAVGSLVSGLATPTESAALTAAYAVLTQVVAHRELQPQALGQCLVECVQVIGGVMLILGMALGLTNYLVDAGIPDAAIEWAQHFIPNRFVFLLALNVFLVIAGALMEIFAALLVLVPLLLPVAMSYGIDPVHFGIIFLANMEIGFLCPPAGMNLYFASAMFGQPVQRVAKAVLPAALAIFLGTLVISWMPVLSTGLPSLLSGR